MEYTFLAAFFLELNFSQLEFVVIPIMILVMLYNLILPALDQTLSSQVPLVGINV